MDHKVEALYRKIFSEGSVSSEEAKELTTLFQSLNPSPAQIHQLQACAFRIGSQYLSDNHDKNVSLFKSINVVCHELEHACMVPIVLEHTDKFEAARVPQFYNDLYTNHVHDNDNNTKQLATIFYSTENPPPVNQYTMVRATAFKTGCDFLSTDNAANVRLLHCIETVVTCFESTCLRPKPQHKNNFTPPPHCTVTHTATIPTVHKDDTITHAVQTCYNLDTNRLTPDKDYVLNVQKGKRPYWKEDDAPDPLFTSVDIAARRRPTYAALIALLQHYSDYDNDIHSLSNKPIVKDPSNCKEIWTFLNSIMNTPVMQYSHRYCHVKNPKRIPSNRHDFIQLLYKIWFERYNREHGGRKDSSGFEHVFVGEVRDNQVSGLHNWVRFYLEEKAGRIDYRGYLKPKSKTDALADSNDHVLTIQFFWKGVEKVMGTSFIGTSPEFEMAVYSLCWLTGEEENAVDLDTGTDLFGLNIKCYTMGHDKIGSAYPEATSHHEE